MAQGAKARQDDRKRQYMWLVERLAGIMPPPPDLVSMGLDVSEPFPAFHSPIIEPGRGLVHDSEFASQLNAFGLIDDLEYATKLTRVANLAGIGSICSA